jgi:Na+/melibiose symporter-like transporter
MKFWQKEIFLYGLPGLPLAFLGLPLVVFLPPIYAEEFGLGLTAVGLMLMISRFWDLFSDPIAGYLGDRILTRPGRRRVMIYSGAPLLIFSCYMLFIPNGTPDGLYLLVWSALLYTGWSWVVIPYSAWGAELSKDYTRRSHITTVREIYVLIGTITVVSLPFLLNLSQDSRLLELIGLVFICLLILTIPGLMLVSDLTSTVRRTGITAGYQLIANNLPLKRLLLAYLMNGIANAIPATLFLLYVEFVLHVEESRWLLLAIYFSSGVLGLLIWLPLAKHVQKHSAWSVAMLFSCFIFIWVPLLSPGDFYLFALICLLTGLSLGIDMSLPAAIQADVIDIDRAGGGGERAGLYFGLWGMATKLSLALAIGFVYPLVQFSGFDPALPTSSGTTALALSYGLLPIPFKLFAAWLVWHFPLDSHQVAKIQRRETGDLATKNITGLPYYSVNRRLFKHETG